VAYPPDVKIRFFELLKQGYSVPQACRKLKIHTDTGYDWIQKREKGALDYLEKKAEDALPNPKLPHELSDEARLALDDFEYWRWRYMGRRSRPWQVEAAHNTVEWLLSDQTELMVVNVAPGAGKSTLYTCDLPLWLICRDRTIREFLGHRTVVEAEKYARRMRRALERTRPLPPDPSQGRDEAADGCLAQDYGRFKPRTGDVWRADEFTVLAEFDGEESIIEDKEATVTAKGMGTEFLGMRSEFVCWDDLITNRILNSAEQMEAQRIWWDNEAVTRVEPGGCLILVGQRMGPEDLYRHCLDERIPPDDADDAVLETMSVEDYDEWLSEQGTSRYKHIVFPAHFEDRCTERHALTNEEIEAGATLDDLAYPNGCLLDPVRIPWKKGANSIRTIRANNETKYRVQYQQEDTDPDSVLVPKLWIEGGIDKDGAVYPGCLDKFRGLCEIPKGLSAPVVSVACADPSPTQYWGIQWWLYHPASEQRFLVDLIRKRMGANEWLDWNENSREFYGIAHDWQARSKELGFPITHWIFEKNAAQQFVLQFDHVHRWMRKFGVQIIGHTTTIRKQDEEYGIQMLRDRYRLGNVRLPYLISDKAYFSSPAKTASDFLIREATTYPQAITTDCLMAQYFLEYNLPTIAKGVTTNKRGHFARRPSFMRERAIA
jgi:transposase